MIWIPKPGDPGSVIWIPEQKTEDYKGPKRWPSRKIPQSWWRKTLHGLRPIEKCLLISLSLYRTEKPTPYGLKKELKIKWETADKWLKILKEKGFLEGEKAYRLPGGDSWGYIGSKWWHETLFGMPLIERCILISIRIAGKMKVTQVFLEKELTTTRKTIRKHVKILAKRGFLTYEMRGKRMGKIG